ncbi:hypothetical protein T492DRAFT_831480 [Pavlovales sp. CCMP2436]|nr:hypothetical protein T492DRAFT_831480 [Pavlovales sp. CCMP2436]
MPAPAWCNILCPVKHTARTKGVRYDKVWPAEQRGRYPTAADSGKVHLTLCIAAEARKRGEKVLVFSQRTMMLDVLERVLQHTLAPRAPWSEAATGFGEGVGEGAGGGNKASVSYWQAETDYRRIDGSVTARR